MRMTHPLSQAASQNPEASAVDAPGVASVRLPVFLPVYLLLP
jgi:hypothetical protein